MPPPPPPVRGAPRPARELSALLARAIEEQKTEKPPAAVGVCDLFG